MQILSWACQWEHRPGNPGAIVKEGYPTPTGSGS